jgi:heme-degrading monooxygenase HmoA
MNETEDHSRCVVCLFWESKIEAHKWRALRGANDAHRKERAARKELAAHIQRSHSGTANGGSQ